MLLLAAMKSEHACVLFSLVCASVLMTTTIGLAQPIGLPVSAPPISENSPALVPPAALPTLPSRESLIAKLRWQATGLLRLKVGYVQNDANVAFVGRSDGFELQHARVAVRADYQSKLAAVLSVEGAVDERSRANAVNGELRVGLKDAFADLALGNDVAGLTIRTGRFAILMDGEEYAGINERAFVSRALVSRGVRPTEGWEARGLLPGRSLGLAFRMEPPRAASGVAIGFEAAVQNGADEFASSNDNDAVALSASLLVQLPERGHLIAAVRYNPRTVGQLPLRQNETDIQGAISANASVGPVRLAAGGVVQRTAFDTTGGLAQIAWGAYGQAMYIVQLTSPLGLGYRFNILDSSSLVLTDRVMEHTIGATLDLPTFKSRLQLNVTHAVEQDDRTLSNDRVEAVMEVSL
jgi:hypothetical protein